MKTEAFEKAILAIGLKIESLQAKLGPQEQEAARILNDAKSDLQRAVREQANSTR